MNIKDDHDYERKPRLRDNYRVVHEVVAVSETSDNAWLLMKTRCGRKFKYHGLELNRTTNDAATCIACLAT
jgi:hypothetical protein